MDSTPTLLSDARKLLLALLVDLAADRNFRPCFKAAHRQLHQFFWELREDPASRVFVQDLLFDTNGNYPHSEQIDQLLQEFQLSGVLSRPNPTYKYNDIAITESPIVVDLKASLPPDQLEQYDKILGRFKSELGVKQGA
jgi:hypothetical protein